MSTIEMLQLLLKEKELGIERAPIKKLTGEEAVCLLQSMLKENEQKRSKLVHAA